MVGHTGDASPVSPAGGGYATACAQGNIKRRRLAKMMLIKYKVSLYV